MEFIIAAASSSAIQVDTGMAAASLLPMTDKLKRVQTASFTSSVEASIRAKIKRQRVGGGYSADGQYTKAEDGGFRSFSQGTKQGSSGHVITYGSVTRIQFNFSYTPQPFHWREIREEEWAALSQGEEAFIRFFEANLPAAIDEDKLVLALTPTFS